jgi:hypothetical protein
VNTKYIPHPTVEIIRVFSAKGTHFGKKWKQEGKHGAHAAPVAARVTSASVKECLAAIGINMWRILGTKIENANVVFAPISPAINVAGNWAVA